MGTAGILTVGNELLNGETDETNGDFLHNRLLERNVRVVFRGIVGDRPGDIITQLRLHRHLDAMLVTGGIGPTHDDLTRQATAHAFNRPLQLHEEAARALRDHYGEDFNNPRQSMANLPRGSEVHILRDVPALAFTVENTTVFPGIPHLLRLLFDRVAERFGGTPLHRESLEFTAREADLAPALASLQDEFDSLEVGSYPKLNGTVTVVLRGEDETVVDRARSHLEKRIDL